MASKKFLVPHDFTSVADTALNHALKVAKTTGGSVHLLHVVSKPAQVDEAREKLQALAQRATASEKVSVEAIVRIGDIFADIANVAEEINAGLIFMGTHGARGWQKISGSHALKVITNANLPFIVVQQKPIKENGYDDIVVPLDLNRQTKQKLTVVAELAKYFDSKVHIIVPKANDSDERAELNVNIVFAKRYFIENGIKFETSIAEDGSFSKEIIRYAAGIDADLIAIMNNTVDNIAGDLFASSAEQSLITNDAQIPVCLLNPQENTSGGSVLFS